MKNGKSPGTDGLTSDFYKFFWIDIKHLVLDSLNYAYEKGELSIDQKRGIITLTPKKDKPRLLIKNWRPISLLNTDYKLLTKCLSGRLQTVLPDIIDHDQTGFLKGRYIGENIRTISDLIEYTSLKNQPAFILLIDFEKAFDTIRWSYLAKCLKFFNFGDTLINWIQIIYNNIESTVINNGHTSQFFKLSRGIRQGCPISPYLFIIAVEVMAIYIRQDKDIKGIWVGNTEIKLSQLADDTSMFVIDIESIKNIIKCLNKFHEISGLKMNVDKTIAKPIGSLIDIDIETLDDIGIVWTKGPLFTLGITISNDPSVNIEKNFRPKLKVMKDLLNIWLSRNLSLKGKITVLKSLALPKLLYVSSNAPIPLDVIKEAENIITNFLWDYKKTKLKKNVLIQAIEEGGLKAPDFVSMVKASRVAWVKRLTSPSPAKWKMIFQALIYPVSIDHYVQTNLCKDNVDTLLPFYMQIFKSWNEIKENPSSPAQYLEQILWKNKYIQTPIERVKRNCKTKSIFYADLYKAGIVKVNDILSANGQWLDLTTLCVKYGIKCNILRYQKLKLSVPKDWLTKIRTLAPLHRGNNDMMLQYEQFNYQINSLKSVHKATTKNIYNCFVKGKKETPTALNKWEEEFSIDINDWKCIFQLPYSCTSDTYLQSFQYKIIHRIFPCNKWFCNLRVIDSDLCVQCNTVDTIQHYLYSCSKIGNFWAELQTWYNLISDDKILITTKHVIFGLYYDNNAYANINFIILFGKMYIRRQKYNDKLICFPTFLIHLKHKLNIEKEICAKKNTLDHFNKKWSKIFELL